MGLHVFGHQWCSSGLSSRASSVQYLDKRRLKGNLVALYSFLERGVMIPSPWDPVMGCVGMVQSCIIRGGLDWTLGASLAGV